jgi:hypothetical protein
MHTSAIIAALPSCRQMMVLSAARRVKRIENSEIALTRHAEHMVGAMDFELIDEYLSASAVCHERAPEKYRWLSKVSGKAQPVQRPRESYPLPTSLRVLGMARNQSGS